MSGNLEKAGITAIPFPKNANTDTRLMDFFTSLALADGSITPTTTKCFSGA